MIRSVQFFVLVTLLVCAVRSEILNTKNLQTCINLCWSCGGTSVFENEMCYCRIPQYDVKAAECLNHVKQQISDFGAKPKSFAEEIANRAARCSDQSASAVGSARQIGSEHVDRVASYFMNGGPLTETGTSLLGASNAGCASMTNEQTAAQSDTRSVAAGNPADAVSRFDAPVEDVPILGAQPKRTSVGVPKTASSAVNAPSVPSPALNAPSIPSPALNAPSVPSPALNAPSIPSPALNAPKLSPLAARVPKPLALGASALKIPSLNAPSARSSGVASAKSPISARSSSPLGLNPTVGSPLGIPQSSQSSSLLGVVPQVLLGIPHAILGAAPGLLELMHPQLLGVPQFPQMLRARHGSPILGASRNLPYLGAPQTSQMLGAVATGAHGVLQNLDDVVSAYMPENNQGQMVGTPLAQRTGVNRAVPKAAVSANDPGTLGATLNSPLLGTVASGTHNIFRDIDNIITGIAPGMGQSNLVGASQTQARDSQSSGSDTSQVSVPSVGSVNPQTDPLHQVLAHHNALLAALSQRLGNYGPQVGAPYLRYLPTPYNSMLGAANSCSCQASPAVGSSSPVAAEAPSQAEEPPTKEEAARDADPSTGEILKNEPSVKEASEVAVAATKEVSQAAEPSTKETPEVAEPSMKEASIAAAGSSTKESAKTTDPSIKETLEAAEPSTKEASNLADSSDKETLEVADPLTNETSKNVDCVVGTSLNSSTDSNTDEKNDEAKLVSNKNEEIAKGNEKVGAKKNEEGEEKTIEEIATKNMKGIIVQPNEETAAEAIEEIAAKVNEIEPMETPQDEKTLKQPKLAAEAPKPSSPNVNCEPKRDLNVLKRRKRQNVHYRKKKDTIASSLTV